MVLATALKEPGLAGLIINYAGMIGMVAVIALVLVLVFKMERIKELSAELNRLKRAFDDLDNQGKIILQTDLELHRAQDELDKKVSGLIALQELTRLISTTLDAEEIFRKIEEKHISQIGFDKALAFTRTTGETGDTCPQGGGFAYRLRTCIGYSLEEGERVMKLLLGQPQLARRILEEGRVFSSVEDDRLQKDVARLLALMALSSFVCAPILQKNGAVGALLVGSESSFTPLTEGDKDLVYILATQIGQALENARLFEETWRSHQELELKVQQRTRELSAALEEIKLISKRKSDFISAVSHELRTPLTSIKGYSSILAAGKLGDLPVAAKERIEKINKHSDSLTNLINNLLDISRIESGRVEMKKEKIDLAAMVAEITDMLAPPIKERGLTLTARIAPGLPAALGDKTQIERVFINLIGNAMKFTPANGEIVVAARDAGERLEVSVSDTGIGIPEKDLEKIFDEFYRVDNDVNMKVKGTGLGLSLVKYIVEAHKGKLTVASTVGKGTAFAFTLPKAPVL
ncbi:MAG: ATP-binding protein [Deltaproteobacteria bacterium]